MVVRVDTLKPGNLFQESYLFGDSSHVVYYYKVLACGEDDGSSCVFAQELGSKNIYIFPAFAMVEV